MDLDLQTRFKTTRKKRRSVEPTEKIPNTAIMKGRREDLDLNLDLPSSKRECLLFFLFGGSYVLNAAILYMLLLKQ
jgi:hypothetical protein